MRLSSTLATVGRVRVLVVEDEARMAALLKRGPDEDGYSVEVANDGQDGLWRAVEGDFDVVILDVMLPGLTGFEVCRHLRARRLWVPVLMLTARDSVAARIAGLDAGADDYLAKPFSFGELTARVRAHTRRDRVEQTALVEVDDLRLDPAAHRCWRGAIELELSVKEFAPLELFLRNPDVVLTRARIREQVWDYAYDGDSNVVDQYVSHLRRKIDRPFGRDQLQTVRGVGYRLRAGSTSRRRSS